MVYDDKTYELRIEMGFYKHNGMVSAWLSPKIGRMKYV